MSVSQIPAKFTGLNTSQVFTTSGTFTVPDRVTFVHVRVRGGDGDNVAPQAVSFYNVTGATGGTTSVDTISAPGGPGGNQFISSGGGIQTAYSGRSGVTVEAFLAVTPGASLTVTIGTGLGSHAVISWGF